MPLKIKAYIIFMIMVTCGQIKATHNRAGEITFVQLGPTSIQMTIKTYTKASSVAADRDSLEVFWGDGTSQWVGRDNALTKFEPNDIKINFYIATHTYPGAATYTISFTDPNRIGGILNVNYPNSIDIQFHLATTFTFLNQQFQGVNNSVVLLQPPIDQGCVNKVFTHNPNAYDIDGDSLAYEFASPLQAFNTPVPDYKLPDQIGPSANNKITINPITGEIVWNSPKLQGEYNIAILIKEYRNGILINSVLRDMQITIRACENDPPKITSIEEICIVAGETLEIDVEVDDQNTNQLVKISATGGPLEIKNPAVLTGSNLYLKPKFSTKVIWKTTCDHISNQYYQIVLKAEDNFFGDSSGLATLKTIRIKVVGPPPKNLTTTTTDGKIKLEWDSPYFCEDTDDDYFFGFSVWRKISSANYVLDTCDPGLSKSTYQRLTFRTLQKANNKYFYIDSLIDKTNTYCYRVQAEFARKTVTGNPFNRVEGLPSDESCIILTRDLPLLTKVSVATTSINLGTINIRWTKPLAEQLDTVKNPGPYRYELFRQISGGTRELVLTRATTSFSQNLDTNYIDQNLNTLEKQYTYSIDFYSNNKKIGTSPAASSVFLSPVATDKKVILNWNATIPWSNYNYKIYIKNNSGVFELLSQTTNQVFEHIGLMNDTLYCYKIEAFGSYGIQNIETPLINFSQEVCIRPVDNVPTCPPTLEVENICERLSGLLTEDDLFNTLSWTDPSAKCPSIGNDVKTYQIFFGPTTSDSLKLIKTQSRDERLSYNHFPEGGLSGCYAVSTIDFNGNISQLSNVVCIDNCPFYELPNTFTPNGDGKNDLLKPRINLFIDRIDLKIYNQWGNLVFETSDPEINWNGTIKGDIPLPDGVYHYVCRVFEKRVDGVTESKDILKGFINILRN